MWQLMVMCEICLHSLLYKFTKYQSFSQCQEFKQGTDLLKSSEDNVGKVDVTGETWPLSVYTFFTKERVLSILI